MAPDGEAKRNSEKWVHGGSVWTVFRKIARQFKN
jgi:hypothetical protein